MSSTNPQSSEASLTLSSVSELQKYITGTTNAESITHIDRLKVTICGERKTGKSKLIADTA